MINIKKGFLLGLLACSTYLTATPSSDLSDHFVAYHMNPFMEDIEDEDAFELIQELVNELEYASLTDTAADELMNLIEEGYRIDSGSMHSLIDALQKAIALSNAKKVIIKAIEYKSPLNTDHIVSLIQTLTYANPTNSATEILLKAIECNVPFRMKARLELAQASKCANARSNVKKIRKALHKRESSS